MPIIILKFRSMHICCMLLYLMSALNISCTKTSAGQPDENRAVETIQTTVAELRNMLVRGHVNYITSDYGGGTWVLDSLNFFAADNTGTELQNRFGQRLKRIFEGDMNIKWFGAKGDSSADETQVFNKAFAAVHNLKKNLYIPAGIYICSTPDSFKHILNLDASGLNDITIYGDGPGSKITSASTSASQLLYIYASIKNNHFSIKNLFFESHHLVTTEYRHGIMLQGTSGENFNNLLISGCTYEGFSTTIIGQGLNGVEISNNIFNAPLGHDNAQMDNSPAVFIWFFDNLNGYCSDIKILNNEANGYSGALPVGSLVSKRPMDGLLYGSGYGYLITGNKTKNFSEEHLAIAHPSSFPNTPKQIIISGNELDAGIPLGAKNQDGSVHSSNYAIRCDANHSTITSNIINHFTTGIMVRTFDYPEFQLNDITISGNSLNSINTPSESLVANAIFVQGSTPNRARHLSIENNQVQVTNAHAGNYFSGISVYDTDDAIISNNQIMVSNLRVNNFKNAFGLSYGRVNGILSRNNTVAGVATHNILGNNDKVIFTNFAK